MDKGIWECKRLFFTILGYWWWLEVEKTIKNRENSVGGVFGKIDDFEVKVDNHDDVTAACASFFPMYGASSK